MSDGDDNASMLRQLIAWRATPEFVSAVLTPVAAPESVAGVRRDEHLTQGRKFLHAARLDGVEEMINIALQRAFFTPSAYDSLEEAAGAQKLMYWLTDCIAVGEVQEKVNDVVATIKPTTGAS